MKARMYRTRGIPLESIPNDEQRSTVIGEHLLALLEEIEDGLTDQLSHSICMLSPNYALISITYIRVDEPGHFIASR